MTNRIYINFRKSEYNKGQGEYTPSYILGRQFSDYEGLISIVDNIIPDKNYTKVNPNGLKNKTKFGYYEYVDGIDAVELIKSINLVASYNAITIIPTVEEAREDVRTRTDLKEVEPGKFLVSEEHTDEITGEIKPAKYLNVM